jgi:hypothetical protein
VGDSTSASDIVVWNTVSLDSWTGRVVHRVKLRSQCVGGHRLIPIPAGAFDRRTLLSCWVIPTDVFTVDLTGSLFLASEVGNGGTDLARLLICARRRGIGEAW